MRDNQLFTAVITILTAGLSDPSILVVAPDAGSVEDNVQQSFQPTNQGVPDGPAVFIYKLGDARYGWLERSDTLNMAHTSFDHTEAQWMESAFQISTLAQQKTDTDPDQVMTASDLCNACAAIMQSDSTREALMALGIGIYRIRAIRNPYFQDDKQQNEANPSFDFTLAHQQVIITSVPVIETFEVHVDRV